MKSLGKAAEKEDHDQMHTAATALNRRNFLKMFGAAVGSGVLLSATPGSGGGSISAQNFLSQGSFLSNPSEDYWRTVRDQFCLGEDVIHMNSGTLGSMSTYVRGKINEYFQIIENCPYPDAYYPPFNLAEAHQKAGVFLGADEDEIVITGCTTEGMSFVANGLDLKAGDEVITTTHEHSGGFDCWQIERDRRGVTLTTIPFKCAYDNKNEIVNLFASAITPQTKVMSFCHINYTSGLRMPVKELCQLARDNNIISVIDGAHAIGMLNLDLHDIGCDFYACSPQKWLCAPPGVGVLYCKKDKQDLLVWPMITESYVSTSFQARLESRGQRTSPVLACLGDAMDFQDTIGRETIQSRILSLSAYAKARLATIPGVHLYSSTDPEQSTGLTSLYVKNKHALHGAINNKIRNDYGIYMRTVAFKDAGDNQTRIGLRISTHIYNNYDQIDLLARAIEENLGMM
jgi:selenocysteine lyase/cysteine desulfurase